MDEEERTDRQMAELLQELRVALPGVQILFAFLLTVPFAQGFQRVTPFQKNLFFATLMFTALSTACLIAPTATHRLRFHKHDRKYVIEVAHDLLIAGLGVPRPGHPLRRRADHRLPVRRRRTVDLARDHRRGDRRAVVPPAAAAQRFIRALGSRCHNGSPMKRLLILGSTGSIGTQALDVIGDDFELVGLSADTGHEALVAQARAHGVKRIALSDPDAAARAAEAWTGGEVLAGPEGLVELVANSDADLVLNAIVGSAGLGPTIVALTEGIDLALANKESLVVGGELVTALAEATGAQIIPVDSEHSALHQLIAGERVGTVDKLVLTASGGPFRGRSRAELEGVTVEQALQHPTWAMGGKITIDSATLMNKGLEVIEAHHLFGTPYDRIDVVVHPQSIVHALVTLCDGAALAHLGHPDMRVPIAYALHHPERVDVPVRTLDLAEVASLTFEPPDEDAFPCLRLARDAAVAGGTGPCVLNAANEVAVHAFLGDRLPFMGVPAVIEATLERVGASGVHGFDSLYQADAEARAVAGELIAVRA